MTKVEILSLEEMNTIDVNVRHMQACDQKIPMLLTYIGHVYFLERNIKHSQVSAEKKVSIIVNNDDIDHAYCACILTQNLLYILHHVCSNLCDSCLSIF